MYYCKRRRQESPRSIGSTPRYGASRDAFQTSDQIGSHRERMPDGTTMKGNERTNADMRGTKENHIAIVGGIHFCVCWKDILCVTMHAYETLQNP